MCDGERDTWRARTDTIEVYSGAKPALLRGLSVEKSFTGTIQGIDTIRPALLRVPYLCFSSFFSSLISLIADRPHHYHPACGH